MKWRTLLSWSSGKDSAWSLHVLRQRNEVEVVGLVTTFNEAANRVAMHAVRRELIEAQARAAGLLLWPVHLPWPCGNVEYESQMTRLIAEAREQGITHFAFRDLFLEEIRAHREQQLAGTEVVPLFPLWGAPADTPGRVALLVVKQWHCDARRRTKGRPHLRRSQATRWQLRGKGFRPRTAGRPPCFS